MDVLYAEHSTYSVKDDEGSTFLIIEDSKPVLKQINVKDAVKRIRKMVKLFKNSPKLCDLLRKKTQLSVVLDVKTR